MSKQSEREAFLVAMSKEGVPLDVARLVLRHAATLQRLAELACSSEAYDRDRVPCPGQAIENDPRKARQGIGCICDYDADTHRHGDVSRGEVKEQQLRVRIEALLFPYNVRPVFQGDPRGAVVKLVVPSGRTDDWGQTGLCVPA